MRETDGDAHRARTPQRRRFPGRANRQRGDRHQVIGAETMQKTQDEGGSEKQHSSIVDSLTRDRDGISGSSRPT